MGARRNVEFFNGTGVPLRGRLTSRLLLRLNFTARRSSPLRGLLRVSRLRIALGRHLGGFLLPAHQVLNDAAVEVKRHLLDDLNELDARREFLPEILYTDDPEFLYLTVFEGLMHVVQTVNRASLWDTHVLHPNLYEKLVFNL